MTKPPGEPRRQSHEPRRRAKPRVSENSSNAVSTVSSHAWPTPGPESVNRTLRSPAETTRPFFLGSTSYAAVFAEEQPIPDSVHEQPQISITATPSSLPHGVMCNRACQLDVGPALIADLCPFSFFERLLPMYFRDSEASALVGPLILSALPPLRRDLEQLAARRDEINSACAEITMNTVRSFKVPATMKASEFHTLFTGPNLRWETIGLVLIIAASSAQFTSPDDPVFILENGKKIEKEEFIADMINSSNSCIHLCQVHGAASDVMLWMLYQNMQVQSNYYGDNHHGVWRRIGDYVSCLFAEGIHCEETFEVPFFLRDSRRRIYAASYRSDKTMATFFGRPPMMIGRYSNRRLPLDIHDDVVVTSDADVLNAAISRLDSEGWNTDGQIFSASWTRVRCQLAEFRERVLEQSLSGEEPDADLVSKLKIISDECRLRWESLPRHLRYDLNEETVWLTLASGKAMRMLTVYLDYLHTEFQIQRLLRRKSQAAVPALLDVSMLLLTSVLVLNKQHNQAYDHQRHYASIILFYCLPSAGVLALELRRCTLENSTLPESISRSDLIRKLSVLIACLEWIALPGDGNYKLCSELNKMLALVLDEVLNHQPSPNASQENGLEQIDQMDFFDMPMMEGIEPIPTESENFLNWLDNANWDVAQYLY